MAVQAARLPTEGEGEAAIPLTRVRPKGLDSFDQLESVWVAGFRFAIPVATLNRQILVEVAAARNAGKGQSTKMEFVHD
jgi:hypothetical protein